MEITGNNAEIDVEITSEKIQEEQSNGNNGSGEINTESVNDRVNEDTNSVIGAADKPKRGRKKKAEVVAESEGLKTDTEWPDAIGVPNPKATIIDFSTAIAMDPNPRFNSLRRLNGLIENLQYKYDPYGFIDWRAMINPKHVVLNRNSVAKAGYVYESLSDSDREKFLNEWPDDKKIIRLAGFKEVARLRGYTSVNNRVEQVGEKVVCHCTIEWIPNFEGNPCAGFTYTAVASASPANVAPEYSQALEAIACNRAFARAVRESLNIHVVSDEELDPNKVEEVSNAKIPSTHPRAQLIKKCGEMGIEFPAVKTMIIGLGLDNIDIVSFDTIPGPTAMSVLDEVRKSQVK